MDGQPMRYHAWGPEDEPRCPAEKQRCAALKVTGWTQSNNGTNSTTSTGAAAGTGSVHTHNTRNYGVNTAGQDWQDASDGSASAADAESVWKAHNCEERLHFICY